MLPKSEHSVGGLGKTDTFVEDEWVPECVTVLAEFVISPRDVAGPEASRDVSARWCGKTNNSENCPLVYSNGMAVRLTHDSCLI